MKEYPVGYSYDDLHIVPVHSTITSRDNVDLTVKLPKGFSVRSPITPANMTFQTPALIKACLDQGSLVALHRFQDFSTILGLVKEFADYGKSKGGLLGASIGVKDEDFEYATALIDAGVQCLVVDVAHADHILAKRIVSYFSVLAVDVLLIAGNVCTSQGADYLFEAGADIVKVGIAGGSVCRTRDATGVHVPQFTAIDDCYRATLKSIYTLLPGQNPYHIPRLEREPGMMLIADGSVKKPADCVKALCRADLVMLGAEFSSTYESVGSWTEPGEYKGSSTLKSKYIEGTSEAVFAKETVAELYDRYHQGIASACSYMNATNLEQIKGYDNFVRVSR